MTANQQMKQVVFYEPGGPEVLTIRQTPLPTPKKGEVLVKMIASSVTSGDLNLRRSAIIPALFRKGQPHTIGVDLVGRVEKVGKGVTGYQVGDLVWGGTGPKTIAHAEYVAISSKQVSLLPKGIDPVLAASIPCVTNTAYVSLVEKGKLRAGQSLLIRGAGGVGLMAIQIAKTIGATITVIGAKRYEQIAKELGADTYIDYKQEKMDQLGAFDLIFDTVGGNLDSFRPHLAPKGKLLTVFVTEAGRALLSSLHGSRRTRLVIAFYRSQTLQAIGQLVEKGQIKPIIDSTYPLEDIVRAHQRAESKQAIGKVLLTMDTDY